MEKIIDGKKYVSVSEPTENVRIKHPSCVGCIADDDMELCLSLSECEPNHIIWKEDAQ